MQPIDLTVTEPEGDDVMPTLVLQRPQGRAVLINDQQPAAAADNDDGGRNAGASVSPARKSNRGERPALDQTTQVFARPQGRRLAAGGQAPAVMRGAVAGALPQQLVDVNVEDASPDPKLPTSLTLVDHEPLPRNDHPAHRRGHQLALGTGGPRPNAPAAQVEPPQHRPRRAASVASNDSAARYQANTRARGRVVESPLFCPRKSATGHTPGQPQPSLDSAIGKSPVYDLTAASDDDSDDEAVRVLLKTKQDASQRRQQHASSGLLPVTQQLGGGGGVSAQQLSGGTPQSANGARAASAPLSLFAASDQLRLDQRREEEGERPLRMSAKLNRRQWQVRLPDESATRMRRASAETPTTPRMAGLSSVSANRASDSRKHQSAPAEASDADDDDMPPPPARAATAASAGLAEKFEPPGIALPPPADAGDGMGAAQPSSPAVVVAGANVSAPPPLAHESGLGASFAERLAPGSLGATDRSPSTAMVNKQRALSVEAVLRAPLGPPSVSGATLPI